MFENSHGFSQKHIIIARVLSRLLSVERVRLVAAGQDTSGDCQFQFSVGSSIKYIFPQSLKCCLKLVLI